MATRLRVLSVVGTRPNMMKIAPIAAELTRRVEEFEHVLVHTGQHYDREMSEIFLEELGVGEPDYSLGVGSGSHAQQTAAVMERLEPVFLEAEPDVVLVPGDVNSTLAAALTAAKLVLPIGHVEAGLRSFDRTMPEEINRIVADQLSKLLFIHSPEARDHLLAEGCAEADIHDVGNTMIDTLVAMRERIEARGAPERYALERGSYLVVTLHRPALVDGPLLAEAMAQLAAISAELPVVFPVHPRTRAALEAMEVGVGSERLRLVDPVGYIEFLSLVEGSAGALTDSGGIQEETTFLGLPCFTLRANTERPITVEMGTNVLLGLAPERIAEVPALLAEARGKSARVPPLWTGRRLRESQSARALPARGAGRRSLRLAPHYGRPSALSLPARRRVRVPAGGRGSPRVDRVRRRRAARGARAAGCRAPDEVVAARRRSARRQAHGARAPAPPSGALRLMRVALSMLTLVPRISGGSETYGRELSGALSRVGRHTYEALVPTLAPDVGAGLPTVVATGYRASATPAGRLRAMTSATIRPGALRAKLETADVVHFPLTVPVPPVSRPTVLTLLDVQHLDLPELFSRGERLFRRLAYDRAARQADQVIVIRQWVRERTIERLELDPERVHAIRLGVDLARSHPSPRWCASRSSSTSPAVASQESRPAFRGVRSGAGRPPGASPRAHRRGQRRGEVAPRGGGTRKCLARRARLALPARGGSRVPEPLRGLRVAAARSDGLWLPGRGSAVGSLPEVCGDAAVLFDPYDTAAIAAGIEQALARASSSPKRGPGARGVVHVGRDGARPRPRLRARRVILRQARRGRRPRGFGRAPRIRPRGAQPSCSMGLRRVADEVV